MLRRRKRRRSPCWWQCPLIGILVLVYYVWTRPPPPPDPLATLVRRHEAIEQRLTTLERHARPVARPRGHRRPPAKALRQTHRPPSMVVDGSALGDMELVVSFDDGPNNETTPILLDTLREHGVHATFFQVGVNIDNEALTHRIVREGHIIGSHTDGHVHLTQSRDVLEDIHLVRDRLRSYLGESPHLLRPPYGETNAAVNRILFDHDYIIMKWNADSVDWTLHTPEQVEHKVLSLLRSRRKGTLLLMHEYPWTTAAQQRLLPQIKAMGWPFRHPSALFTPEQRQYLWDISQCPDDTHMWCRHLHP